MARSSHSCPNGSYNDVALRMESSWPVCSLVSSESGELNLPTGDYFGGVIFPIIMPPLIARWGIQITTRIYAFTFAIVLLPALPFLKARLPESRVHGPSPRSGARAWMKDRSFWFFIVINTLQGFAHFVPLTWLPSKRQISLIMGSSHPSATAFATAIGLSPQQASLTLTLANCASVFAGFFVGYLSDRLNAWFLALVSLVCTSLATFVLWGAFSYSLAGILAYGLVYGTTAGCWSSMWNAFVRPVASASTSLFSFPPILCSFSPHFPCRH